MSSINTPIDTSFLVISDTHGLDIHGNTAQPFSLPLPKVDVLLHCGDLTQVGGHGPYRKALKMLGEIDAELKLVIAGNHDLELDKDYWLSHLDEEGGDEPEEHDQAVAIMKGPLAKAAGVTYLEEGTHSFTLKSGASFSIFVSPYSPAFGDWAFGNAPSENRFANLQDHVDILMTHGPPKNILDACPQGNVGCEHALDALRRTKPMMHCFGHIHEGHGAKIIIWNDKTPNTNIINTQPTNIDKTHRWNTVYKGNKADETLAINAAIQGDKGAFCNAPWLLKAGTKQHCTLEWHAPKRDLSRLRQVPPNLQIRFSLAKVFAFQHMITVFETHAILVRGLSGEDAGVFSSKPYGGSYRRADELAFVGSHEFAKPSEIPKAMRSLVEDLQRNIQEINRTGYLDPWKLAAKYCDRMVNVHPFQDGNGRMCRIILNTILIKYVGFVVTLGEKDQDRDEYISAAQESRDVGGLPGYLSTLVLKNAGGTLEILKSKLKRRSKNNVADKE